MSVTAICQATDSQRIAYELAALPRSGGVFSMPVVVPGLPVNISID